VTRLAEVAGPRTVVLASGLVQGLVMLAAAVFLRLFPLVRGTDGGRVAGRR
jgi:hypothetical protein